MNRLIPTLFRFPFLIITVLFISTACAPQQQDVIYVVVTNTPEGALTQGTTVGSLPTATSALPTATPAPTATPTLPPDVALTLATDAMISGYYADAMAAYQSVLDQGAAASVDQRGAAALALGQAALREGFFSEAVNALSILINELPNDPRVAQAYYLRGDAYMGLSEWQSAINDYQTYLSLRPGLVDSYAHESIGDGQLALGLTDAALISYEAAANASRGLVPLLQLREKIAQVYLNAGQLANAIAQYDAILVIARNAPYRATIEFYAASALIDGGDLENGLARMQTIFETYPERPEAYQAAEILTANGAELDAYQRGRTAYFYGDYQTAIDLFSEYGTYMQLAAIPAEMYLLLGRAYREIQNPEAARVAFQTIIDQYPRDPLFGEALLEQGRTRFLSGDVSGAIERYRFIADNYAYLETTAAEALWRIGYLQGTNNQLAESRQTFSELAERFPATDQARSGLFIAASAAVNAGDNAAAETLYARIATIATGEDQAAAYLWVGRLAQLRGAQDSATEAFRLAQQAAPDTYFAARARDIISGVVPFQPPAAYQFTFDEQAQRLEAENWLRTTFGVQQEGDLYPLSAELAADPRVVRGRELWALGHFAEAEEEFNELLEEMQGNGLASYQLAVMLRDIACYSPSIVAAANVIRAAGVGTLDAPAYLARMRYPTYYLDIVQDVGSRRGVDPLLMFSLIRHESLFDTTATAAAGEKGLTQVIPQTAAYIAEQIQWADYQHSDLFSPNAGIEFGAFYLQEQLGRFDGNVMVALSGYNAGPGRAQNWLELSGGDPDLLMTTITIDSTRLYVQRIYSHYSIYRALYGAQ